MQSQQPQRSSATLPPITRESRAHTGAATDSPANIYAPVFMPEETIYIVATGGIVQDWVASVPKCLAFESVSGLIAALQALNYPYTESFEYLPFPPAYGTTFGGGPRGNGSVPWLGISPVPVINGQWRAEDGAFAVNAGVYAHFWNHGVHPFIGSSYEVDLRNDIAMRIESAKNGQPVI